MRIRISLISLIGLLTLLTPVSANSENSAENPEVLTANGEFKCPWTLTLPDSTLPDWEVSFPILPISTNIVQRTKKGLNTVYLVECIYGIRVTDNAVKETERCPVSGQCEKRIDPVLYQHGYTLVTARHHVLARECEEKGLSATDPTTGRFVTCSAAISIADVPDVTKPAKPTHKINVKKDAIQH
jgi:hypothetical protein